MSCVECVHLWGGSCPSEPVSKHPHRCPCGASGPLDSGLIVLKCSLGPSIVILTNTLMSWDCISASNTLTSQVCYKLEGNDMFVEISEGAGSQVLAMSETWASITNQSWQSSHGAPASLLNPFPEPPWGSHCSIIGFGM